MDKRAKLNCMIVPLFSNEKGGENYYFSKRKSIIQFTYQKLLMRFRLNVCRMQMRRAFTNYASRIYEYQSRLSVAFFRSDQEVKSYVGVLLEQVLNFEFYHSKRIFFNSYLNFRYTYMHLMILTMYFVDCPIRASHVRREHLKGVYFCHYMQAMQ